MLEYPICILEDEVKIVGVFRGYQEVERLCVFIPAHNGTRIGPQRIFVEIARSILEQPGFGTLCFDLPRSGDSMDKVKRQFIGRTNQEKANKFYNFYLEKILEFINKSFPNVEIILITMSLGCVPILEFAKTHNIFKIVLLSPNYMPDKRISISYINLKVYFIKIFQVKTWKKLILFRLNVIQIFFNLIKVNRRNRIQSDKKANYTSNIGEKTGQQINALCIFAERDPYIKQIRTFWHEYEKKNIDCLSISKIVIEDADHNFFKWIWKCEVKKSISNWLLKC